MNMFNDTDSILAEKFKIHGYRLTKPRKAVLMVLNETSKHLSAEDIYLAIHKSYKDIGFATIYRTLDLLVQMNLVNRFEFGDGKARYELIYERKEEPTHHHHLICTRCGKVIDYSDFIEEETKKIERIECELSKKYNFRIDRHIIQFYGLCDECKSENNT